MRGDTLPAVDSLARVVRLEKWEQHPFYRDSLSSDSVLQQGFPGQENIQVRFVPETDNLGAPVLRNREKQYWRYLVLLVLMAMVGLARLISPGVIVTYFRAFFKPKLLSEVLEEQNSEISSFSILLSLYTAMLYALPIQYYLWMTGSAMTDYPFGDYILIGLLIFSFIVARFVLSSIGGRVLEAKYFAGTSIYASVLLNFFLASLMIPVYLLLVLNDWIPGAEALVIGAGVAVLLATLLKVFRAWTHAASAFPYPPFYLILYLCAFEAGPWLWVWKLLETNLI